MELQFLSFDEVLELLPRLPPSSPPPGSSDGDRAGRPRKPQSHNMFFACVPPPDIASQIGESWCRKGTRDQFRDGVLHMTLQAVEQQPQLDTAMTARALRAGAAVEMAPFELCFDRLTAFVGQHARRAIVLTTGKPSVQVNLLALQCRNALARSGIKLPAPRVTPHLTLAYGAGFEGYRILDEPVRWKVTEFSLIDSHVGLTHHEILGTWPLKEK